MLNNAAPVTTSEHKDQRSADSAASAESTIDLDSNMIQNPRAA